MKTIRVKLLNPDFGQERHKFGNFCEDIWRELADVCEVDLDAVDQGSDILTIKGIKNRLAGDVMQKVRHLAKQHYMLEFTEIKFVSSY